MVLKQVRRNVETQFKSRNLAHVLDAPGALRYCIVVPPPLSSPAALQALSSAAKVADMPIFPFCSQDAALASAWATKTCGPQPHSEYEKALAARAELLKQKKKEEDYDAGRVVEGQTGDGLLPPMDVDEGDGGAAAAAAAAADGGEEKEKEEGEKKAAEKEEKPKTFADWVRREAKLGASDVVAAAAAGSTPLHRVLFVDCGHSFTSATVFDVREGGIRSLASEGAEVGARSFDEGMFVHFSRKLAGEHFAGDESKVSPKTKAGGKILKACRKLKQLLSTIQVAKVTVENVKMDTDSKLEISRDDVAKLVADEIESISNVVKRAAETAGPASITAVEVVGGGSRIPQVQAAIATALQECGSGCTALGRHLDGSSSIATGTASLVASSALRFAGECLVSKKVPGAMPLAQSVLGAFAVGDSDGADAAESTFAEEIMTAATAEEEAMSAVDARLAAKQSAVNELETYIMDFRQRASGSSGYSHSDKIDGEKVRPLLNAAEEWHWDLDASDDADSEEKAGAAVYKAKLDELKAEVEALCPDYFAAVQADKEKREEELRAAAAAAKEEEKQNGGREDVDNRKLPKSKRMNLVKKNKEEGTTLFKAKNYELASIRYTRALGHCKKFFDLSDEDEAEVKALKLSLQLNLALVAMKQEAWDKVITHSGFALELDEKNGKAFYRRAMALEKTGKYDEAKKDVKKATQLVDGSTPAGRAVAKLAKRVDAQIARQVAKQRKFAQRMFS